MTIVQDFVGIICVRRIVNIGDITAILAQLAGLNDHPSADGNGPLNEDLGLQPSLALCTADFRGVNPSEAQFHMLTEKKTQFDIHIEGVAVHDTGDSCSICVQVWSFWQSILGQYARLVIIDLSLIFV